MTKVMIALEKATLDRLWLRRETDHDNWNEIVANILVADSPSTRRRTTLAPAGNKYQVEVLGERYHCATAIDGLVWCLETLARLDDRLVERVAKAVKSRSRNHIAQSRSEIYPKRPDLAVNARQIVGGWYVGANISNRDKLRIVQLACKAAGLAFGSDVKWLVSQ